jgi:hypothetical protein
MTPLQNYLVDHEWQVCDVTPKSLHMDYAQPYRYKYNGHLFDVGLFSDKPH